MSEDRKQEGLSALGHKTAYSTDYNPDVLEAFENLNKENDYWVRFNCPEFTALCPITGQPDFAEIRISYIPDVKMVESKSLKLYLHSYRKAMKVIWMGFAMSAFVALAAGLVSILPAPIVPAPSMRLLLLSAWLVMSDAKRNDPFAS